MILGASNCAPDNRHIDDVLARDRMRNRTGIETCIRRAVDASDLVRTTNVRGLANLFHTFLTGIAFEARDGAGGGDLDEAVTALMQIWELHMAESGLALSLVKVAVLNHRVRPTPASAALRHQWSSHR